MKSCRICGTENEDTNKFCTECGASFELSPFVYKEEAVSSGYVPPSLERHVSLLWHKLLVIVWSFGGFLGIVRGIIISTGSIYHLYGLEPLVVYSFYPKLDPVNTIYGFVRVALGIYQVYTFQDLRLFCKNSPRSMVIFFILYIISSFVFQIASNAAVGRISDNFVLNLLLTAALIPYLIINIIYYRKRKDLFIN